MDRFWSKVDKTPGCWIWTASRNSAGYGAFGWKGKVVSAHRVAYELENGPIQPGLYVLHRCDNPKCVRPDHLFLGSQAENVTDMFQKSRQHSTKGSNNGRAKLTEVQAKTIHEFYRAGGFTQKQLAWIFCVSHQAVNRIVNERSWGHLAAPASVG